MAFLLVLAGCGGLSHNRPEGQSLDVLLGTPSPEVLRSRVLDVQTLVQEQVAACMKEQGFDYIPWVPPHILPPVPPPEFAGLTEHEITKRYGFGILTVPGDDRVEAPDPNLEIYQSLGEVDQRAYRLALEGSPSTSGDDPIGDEGVAVIIIDSAHRGGASCRQKAFDAVYPYDERPSPEVLDTYRELYAELQNHIDADPDVDAAWGASQRCLGEAGIRSGSGKEIEPIDYFLTEAEAMLGTPVYSADELDSLVSDGLVDKSSAARARELERTLALTTYDCMDEYRSTRARVSQRLEREFIDENYSLIVEAAPGL